MLLGRNSRWQNTLFGELILKLVNEGKVDLLNSL
jgi:hypothetical protein